MTEAVEVVEEAEDVVIPSKEELLGQPQEDNEDVDDEGTEEEAPELTEIEQKAIDMGWNKEGVEGKKNLSAEEFVDRKALYDDLHSLKRKNKQLQGDIENINKYQKQIREDERKKVITQLKADKVIALENEDHHRVVEIDEQLADERLKTTEDTKTVTNPAYDSWIAENSWYEEDVDMKDEAEIYGEIYARRNGGASPEEIYKAVTKHVKKEFPDKFGNVKRDAPSPVSPSTPPASKSNKQAKLSAKNMPAADRQIMKTILRTTSMSEQDYLKEYYEMQQ